MAEKTYTYVPAELKSATMDGVVVSAEGVFDYDYGENGEKQSEINRRVAEALGLEGGPSPANANNSRITLKDSSGTEIDHFTLNQEESQEITIPTPNDSQVRFHKGNSENAFASFTLNKGSDTDIWLDEPGNGTLKFTKNGTVFETFSANQSEDVTIDLTGIGPNDNQTKAVQSDWNETNSDNLAYIKNKPNLDDYATKEYVDNAIENLTPGEGRGEENQFAFSNINVTSGEDENTIEANDKTDTFSLVAGNNVSFNVNSQNKSITINASVIKDGEEDPTQLKTLNTTNESSLNTSSNESLYGNESINLHKISKTGRLDNLVLENTSEDFVSELRDVLGLGTLYQELSHCTASINPSTIYVGRQATIRFTVSSQLTPKKIIIKQEETTLTTDTNISGNTWNYSTNVTPQNAGQITYSIIVTGNNGIEQDPIIKTITISNDSIQRIQWNGNVNNGNSIVVGNEVDVNKGTATVYWISGTTESTSDFTLSASSGNLNGNRYTAPSSVGSVTFTATYNNLTDTKTISIVNSGTVTPPTPVTKTVYYGFAPENITNINYSSIKSEQISSMETIYSVDSNPYNGYFYYVICPSTMTLIYVKLNGYGFTMRQLKTMTISNESYTVYESAGSSGGYEQRDDYNFEILLR